VNGGLPMADERTLVADIKSYIDELSVFTDREWVRFAVSMGMT
jgi:hypothetical protein